MSYLFAAGLTDALMGGTARREQRFNSVLCSSSDDLSPSIIKPLGGLTPKSGDRLPQYKAWQADPKGVGSVFSRNSVLKTVGLNSFLNMQPLMDKWFSEVIETSGSVQHHPSKY